MDQGDPIDLLFARARQHNVSMAAICRAAEIDPTTPSRWKRKKNGATVDRVVRLNAALDAILSAAPEVLSRSIAA